MDIVINIPKVEVHVHMLSADAQAGLAAIPAVKAALLNIFSNTERIMATQDQGAQALEAVGVKLDKISGETTALVAQVAELKAAAAESGNVSPRMQAAIDSLASKADSIDGLVDDIAPNPTETPEAPAEGGVDANGNPL